MNSQYSTIILRIKRASIENTAVGRFKFSVQGSLSGAHAGKIIYAEAGYTAIFKPDMPFNAGERVAVSVLSDLFSPSDEDDSVWTFGFSVSRLSEGDRERISKINAFSEFPHLSAPASNISLIANERRAVNPDSLPSDLLLPVISKSDSPADEPIYLSTWRAVVEGNRLTYDSSASKYLLIIDNTDHAIFYRKIPAQAFDFKLLANGNMSFYDASAEAFYEMDSAYSIVDTFHCQNGYTTDGHDMRLLPGGHMLLIGQDYEFVDMSGVVPGGNAGALVIGAILQELDENKNVVFQWRSFDNFQITDATHEDLTASTIDYVHANAIEIDTDGNVLLSSRHMDEITKIDRQTGDIIWRWGGKNNQFTFINDTLQFSHQHSINRTPSGTFTLFDNGNFHTPEFSRAVEYVLDQQEKTATLVWQYRHSPDTYTFAMGSVERLPNGNTFIGWGANNSISATEVRPDGSIAYEIVLPDSLISYRAFRFQQKSPIITAVAGSSSGIPLGFQLSQNYPNPFNPNTVIGYELPVTSRVSLKVYNLLGQEVATLFEGILQPGKYDARFDGSGLASGVYFYRLQSDGFVGTKKLLLLK